MVVQALWSTQAILPTSQHITSMNIRLIFDGLACRRALRRHEGRCKKIGILCDFLIFTLCSCCASLVAAVVVGVIIVVIIVVVVVLNSTPSLVVIVLMAKQSLPSTAVGLQSQNCLCVASVACIHALET